MCSCCLTTHSATHRKHPAKCQNAQGGFRFRVGFPQCPVLRCCPCSCSVASRLLTDRTSNGGSSCIPLGLDGKCTEILKCGHTSYIKVYRKQSLNNHLTNHIQVRTVGRVPAGLPPGTLRWWLPPEENLTDLLWVAAPLALVGLMESIAIAKALAAAAHEDIDANQELVGGSLGLRMHT